MGAVAGKLTFATALKDAAALNEFGFISYEGTLLQGECKMPIFYKFKQPFPCSDDLPRALLEMREELGYHRDTALILQQRLTMKRVPEPSCVQVAQ